MSKLTLIQSELKAPKNQYNEFGKYKYRNCEDILEAVKPLLKKHGGTLHISDEIVNVGDRYYVRSTAIFIEGTERICSDGYAREAFIQKGMNDAQITGSSSSYARKYALNGLFLIDDTKDADSQDNTEKAPQNPPAQGKKPDPEKKFPTTAKPILTKVQFEAMKATLAEGKIEVVEKAYPKYNIDPKRLQELLLLIGEAKEV